MTMRDDAITIVTCCELLQNISIYLFFKNGKTKRIKDKFLNMYVAILRYKFLNQRA